MLIDDLAIARIVHVAAIVGWIGGVWFVTFVIMPTITRSEPPAMRLEAFHRIEAGFARQAQVWVLLAGASGVWMAQRGNMWWRFAKPEYWWMHAMTGLWLIFFLMLFVAEPLVLHRRMANSPTPDRDFDWMVIVHRILSLAALVTIAGAAAGAHGLI